MPEQMEVRKAAKTGDGSKNCRVDAEVLNAYLPEKASQVLQPADWLAEYKERLQHVENPPEEASEEVGEEGPATGAPTHSAFSAEPQRSLMPVPSRTDGNGQVQELVSFFECKARVNSDVGKPVTMELTKTKIAAPAKGTNEEEDQMPVEDKKVESVSLENWRKLEKHFTKELEDGKEIWRYVCNSGKRHCKFGGCAAKHRCKWLVAEKQRANGEVPDPVDTCGWCHADACLDMLPDRPWPKQRNRRGKQKHIEPIREQAHIREEAQDPPKQQAEVTEAQLRQKFDYCSTGRLPDLDPTIFRWSRYPENTALLAEATCSVSDHDSTEFTRPLPVKTHPSAESKEVEAYERHINSYEGRQQILNDTEDKKQPAKARETKAEVCICGHTFDHTFQSMAKFCMNCGAPRRSKTIGSVKQEVGTPTSGLEATFAIDKSNSLPGMERGIASEHPNHAFYGNLQACTQQPSTMYSEYCPPGHLGMMPQAGNPWTVQSPGGQVALASYRETDDITRGMMNYQAYGPCVENTISRVDCRENEINVCLEALRLYHQGESAYTPAYKEQGKQSMEPMKVVLPPPASHQTFGLR